MKIKISFFIVLAFSAFAFAKSGKIKLHGKVQNQTAENISISDLGNNQLFEMDLKADGSFKGSVKVTDGYFMLKYGRNTFYVYLYPKDDLEITFDALEIEKTLSFKGDGAERNNYLNAKRLLNKQTLQDIDSFYSINEDQYLINISNLKAGQEQLMANYDLSSFFMIEEKKSIHYDFLLSLKNFQSSLEFYRGEEVTPTSDYLKPLEEIDYTDEKEYQKHPYYRYLTNYHYSNNIEDASGVDAKLAQLRNVPHQPALITLVNGFYGKISNKTDHPEEYLELIKKVTSHKPFIDAAQKKYDELLQMETYLSQGSPSPGFEYESIDGSIVSLSNFRGKYVYIDVWATWCAPCIQQIPYLKELEERFKNDSIVFVSISVDKKRDKKSWKKMIDEKSLHGIQLFADKSFDSDFMEAYAVHSIPRFIILDPEGNVIDANAPRPSFKKTTKILNSLLVEKN